MVRSGNARELAADHRLFAKRVWIVCGIAALAAAIVSVLVVFAQVPLMLFLAVLGALLLDSISGPLRKHLNLPRRLAVCLVTLAAVGATVGACWTWGPRVAAETADLLERLPQALNRVEESLRERGWGAEILSSAEGWSAQRLMRVLSEVWGPLAGVFATAFAAAGGVLVVAVTSFFLALDPAPYVNGPSHLAKASARDRYFEVLGDIDRALRWWLVGRFSSMAVVEVLTAGGLFLLGAPHPVLLGVLAGLLSFIPYLGPILSAVPAVLVGLAEGTGLALWILALYGGIQIVESNLITPLIQVRAVSLPPAVLILAQLLLGALFGILGVLVATPLTIATIVAVQTLYVRDVLDEPIEVLGDHGKPSRSAAARRSGG